MIHRANAGVVIGLACVLASGAPGPAFPAEKPWIEVTSPHFRVLSNADERAARTVAMQFEQIHAVFRKAWPWARTEPTQPLLILVARDERTFKALLPRFWEQKGATRPSGLFIEGRDRYYVALTPVDRGVDEEDSANPYLTLYHEYIHVLLSLNFETLPVWFNEGMAEYFGNTVVREKDIIQGRVIPWHILKLRQGAKLPIERVLRVDHRSAEYNQDDKSSTFYATCWALMHYLLQGEKRPATAAQLNHFSSLLRNGVDGDVAFTRAFGDVAALQRDFDSHIARPVFKYMRIGLDVDVKPDSFATRTSPAAESAALRAAFQVAMGRPVEARALLDEARRSEPEHAGVADAEGLLADLAGNAADAMAAYSRAAKLGSRSDHTHYRLAQLQWKPDGGSDTLRAIESELRIAAQLNPQSASALSFLAEVTANLGRPAEALPLAERAVTIEPSDSYHRIALANVLYVLRRLDDARRQAQIAVKIADSDEDRANAARFVKFLDERSDSR